MIQVKNPVVDEWLKAGKSRLPICSATLMQNGTSSVALPEDFRLNVHVDIKRGQASVRNVIGYIPGRTRIRSGRTITIIWDSVTRVLSLLHR